MLKWEVIDIWHERNRIDWVSLQQLIGKSRCSAQNMSFHVYIFGISFGILDVQGLLAGETVAGLAGGVNAQMLPITTCTICGLSALSREARCKTFDSSADGYGRGEGFAGRLFYVQALV